jgi:carbon storage regulator
MDNTVISGEGFKFKCQLEVICFGSITNFLTLFICLSEKITAMMKLTREASETSTIGDTIKVTVLGTKPGGQVSIGIEAPKDVTILRQELALEITKTIEYVES